MTLKNLGYMALIGLVLPPILAKRKKNPKKKWL